jgi:hypothetical protein
MVGVPARVLGFGRHPRLVQGLLVGGSVIAIVRGRIRARLAAGGGPDGRAPRDACWLGSRRPPAAARAERAADRFAADRGVAGDLAHALTAIGDGRVPCTCRLCLRVTRRSESASTSLLPAQVRTR